MDARTQPLGGQGFMTPSKFLLTPILDRAFYMGVSLALLHCNKVDYFKISLSSIHQVERFEVQNSKNFLGRGSPSPLRSPSLLFIWLRPLFGLRPIRTPQFLKRVCALEWMPSHSCTYKRDGIAYAGTVNVFKMRFDHHLRGNL